MLTNNNNRQQPLSLVFLTLLVSALIHSSSSFQHQAIIKDNRVVTPSTKLFMANDDQHRESHSTSSKQGETARSINRRQAYQRMAQSFLLSSTTAIIGPNINNSQGFIAKADIVGVVTPSTFDPTPKQEVGTNIVNNFSDGEKKKDDGFVLYTTRSGLKYIELEEGNGPSPEYGQLCSVSYKAYVKLPDTSTNKNQKLQEYDSDNAYLIKHGNGRMIPGLDEGLHTMKVGGKRRIIIPPKLGYVGPGVLGPLPETPWGRYRLNSLLDQMVELKGGNVVFDVDLRAAMNDEADQGYYEDDSISPEDFNTLRTNIQKNAAEARAKGAKTVDFLGAIE